MGKLKTKKANSEASTVRKAKVAKTSDGKPKKQIAKRKQKFFDLVAEAARARTAESQRLDSGNSNPLESLRTLRTSLRDIRSINVFTKRNPKRMTIIANEKIAARELQRFQQILRIPAFQANPLAAMKEHLSNTLADAVNTNYHQNRSIAKSKAIQKKNKNVGK